MMLILEVLMQTQGNLIIRFDVLSEIKCKWRFVFGLHKNGCLNVVYKVIIWEKFYAQSLFFIRKGSQSQKFSRQNTFQFVRSTNVDE